MASSLSMRRIEIIYELLDDYLLPSAASSPSFSVD